MWELILSLNTRERPHGERFVYRSIETDVPGFCMERASNKRLPQLFPNSYGSLWGRPRAPVSPSIAPASRSPTSASTLPCATSPDSVRSISMTGCSTADRSCPRPGSKRPGHAITRGSVSSRPLGAYGNRFRIEHVSRPAVMCRGVFGQPIYIDAARYLVGGEIIERARFSSTSYWASTHCAWSMRWWMKLSEAGTENLRNRFSAQPLTT
jgi:hypothetical protein